jgi:hypothetical protein
METLERELREHGVVTALHSLLETASLAAIRRSIDWWDRQSEVGPGVLVEVIRRGGVAEQPQATSLLEREREYGERVAAWLNTNFPEFTQPSGNPHCAAITAVIRLHHEHGKGQITRREHGAVIRQAVKDFDAKWGTG